MAARVMVALSGGVDSSVSALLLQRAGYALSGVHLRLIPEDELAAKGISCPRPEAEDAATIARRLDFPFHTFDFSRQFRDSVMENFVSEYEAGRTPNPCIVCNRRIKFGALLEQVLSMGGEFMATGHYARIRRDPVSGRFQLLRGVDRQKDQSYFLYLLTQEQLSHVLFPLGDLHKSEVRALAEANGLITARKRDSQDICFVPDGDYAAVVEALTGRPSPVGPFLDRGGSVLGQHKGFIRYTRGQHKGLGLSIEPPLYVLDKDPETAAIRLGHNEELFSNELIAKDVNWVSVAPPAGSLEVTAKARYSQNETEATVTPLSDGRIRVVFRQPQRAITPGQAVVLYDGDAVVGGGTICRE